MVSIIDTAKITVGDLSCTTYGGKIARVSNADGSDVIVTPKDAMRGPFDPSTFDKDPKAQRINLTLEVSDLDLQATLVDFDSHMLRYLADNSERIFKRPMSLEQVEAGYNNCLYRGKGNYAPTLKTKIDISGPRALRCWSPKGERLSEYPKDWRSVRVRPVIHFSHLYTMGTQFGVVVKVSDVQIAEVAEAAPQKNPFF